MSHDKYYFTRSSPAPSGQGTLASPFYVGEDVEVADDRAEAIREGILRMEYAVGKQQDSVFLLSGASMATVQTDYVGGWTFTNLGGVGNDWTSLGNIGTTADLTYATVVSGLSKYLTGTSGYPSFGLPEGAEGLSADVNIRFGPTGTILGGGRPLFILLFDGVNFGSPHAFDLTAIAPGSVNFVVSKSFADWGLTTPERIAAWIAQPSLAILQGATPTGGTPRIDAITTRMTYLAPLSPSGGYNRLTAYAKRRSSSQRS